MIRLNKACVVRFGLQSEAELVGIDPTGFYQVVARTGRGERREMVVSAVDVDPSHKATRKAISALVNGRML